MPAGVSLDEPSKATIIPSYPLTHPLPSLSLSLFLTLCSLLLLTRPHNYPYIQTVFLLSCKPFLVQSCHHHHRRCHSPLLICPASLTVRITSPFIITQNFLQPFLAVPHFLSLCLFQWPRRLTFTQSKCWIP